MSSGPARGDECGGEAARGGERARHGRGQQRTGLDLDDLMRAGAHEAGFGASSAMRVTRDPRVERRPAASFAMGIDERADLGGDARLMQRVSDEAALPFAIGGGGERLHGAAAAHA